MNFDRERDFEQNMTQLIQLLKKLIKNIPGAGNPFNSFSPSAKDKDGNVQLNIFFNFLPISPEDMDELEEAYEEALFQDDKRMTAEDLSSELSAEDIEFLRRHGLRF